jgi:thiamine biosynthesis protein ThiS|tara:strand:- start:457 stop:660 length:204 start_codon:yes stop_codon:yes gene_type:complete
MLRITINGETHSFAVGTTVEQMLEALELPREGVAVEVNRGIVPRRTHQEVLLSDGDEVEVVTFVGGG